MKLSYSHRWLLLASAAGAMVAGSWAGVASAKTVSLETAVRMLSPPGQHVRFAPGVATRQMVTVPAGLEKDAALRRILSERGLSEVGTGRSALIVADARVRPAPVDAMVSPSPRHYTSPGFSMSVAPPSPPKPVMVVARPPAPAPVSHPLAAPAKPQPAMASPPKPKPAMAAPPTTPKPKPAMAAPTARAGSHAAPRPASLMGAVSLPIGKTAGMSTAQLNDLSARTVGVKEAPLPAPRPAPVAAPAKPPHPKMKVAHLPTKPHHPPLRKAPPRPPVSVAGKPPVLSNVMVPVPPVRPVSSSAIGETWIAGSGSTMARVLGQWAARAGWHVVYDSNITYPISASATFDGDFLSAVRQFVYSVHADPPPIVHVYPANHVIVVSARQKD